MTPPRAVISPCGLYRYRLTREWGDLENRAENRVLWILLNPSIADSNIDDPTIRKVTAFSRLWGFEAMDIGNLFAFRATDPKAMKKQRWPLEEQAASGTNDAHLMAMASGASQIVFGWGVHGVLVVANHVRCDVVRRDFLKAAEEKRIPWPVQLGETANGQPKHPLYISYAAKRQKVAA